ncbi:MAG: hypothetical protein EP329_06730 [Deltaproteobacteria bacterium]|nr:MAG: hypothetical protein EP329_06730 [Deltaproteobacteria bacterium]
MEHHPFDDAFPDMRASRRRRALVSIVVFAVLVAGAVILLLLPSRSRCDGAAVREYIADRRLPFGLVGEVCRFDEPLAAGLRDLAVAPPDRARLLTLKALAESALLLSQVCPDGIRVLQAAAELPLEAQGTAFAERCNLSALGPLNEAQLTAAGAERLALALVIHHLLAETDPDAAKPVGRRIILGR